MLMSIYAYKLVIDIHTLIIKITIDSIILDSSVYLKYFLILYNLYDAQIQY